MAICKCDCPLTSVNLETGETLCFSCGGIKKPKGRAKVFSDIAKKMQKGKPCSK
jgi:hypothetical protein